MSVKKIVLLDADVMENFVNGDPPSHHAAEQQIKAEIRRQLENPTNEESFEAEHRQKEVGLIVRGEELEHGEVQVSYLDEDGDFVLFTGPKYTVQMNRYPGTGTTQLTVKKIDPEEE